MSTITLSTAPGSHVMSVPDKDETFVSLTGAMQVQARAGTCWNLSMTWRRGGTAGRTLRGELASLQGKRNRLYVPMSKLGYIRGGASGSSATVHGSHVTGQTTLTLRGLTANTSNILLPGDFIEIGSNGQLVQATTTLNSTGSPNTRGTVGIWPPLNKDRADGVTVNLATPGGMFIMMTPFGFTAEPMPTSSNWYGEISAEFVEDVLA